MQRQRHTRAGRHGHPGGGIGWCHRRDGDHGTRSRPHGGERTDPLHPCRRHGDDEHLHRQLLAAWPPLTVATAQQAAAAPGVTGQLATFVRPEGTIQVTYNGQPLYYWQGDTKPGDVTGQGKAGFSVAMASGLVPTSGAPSPSASGY